ncbi:hypothetical protein LCGC14_0095610 [marine sediment metagenome]|uniref:Uroporphyrinogen decarboxylase (URO-D) domain-containing protein n=1 Tax=marine sediment metagenome TaxID=412755 RepID=A0A0F9VUL2_9ZZZZ|nr:hypothetical protein [Phycisphaerae bacterium]HDZ44159.1 hypothetical protein [Phycisphaerae bacterium]
MSRSKDIEMLRGLAEAYAEAAADPRYDELRQLWRDHNSLKPVRPLFCLRPDGGEGEVPEVMHRECEDDSLYPLEHQLRFGLWRHAYPDDFIIEPWLSVRAAFTHTGWGVGGDRVQDGYSFKITDYPLKTLDDVDKLVPPRHEIDGAATAERYERVCEAVGDLIPVDLDRSPWYNVWSSDLSTDLGWLRGIQQFMFDMVDEPAKLHRVMAFMRDGILAVHQQAADAGDWGLSASNTLTMPYANELPGPAANVCGVDRKQLWWFTPSQEFTLVSPAMHEEFLLQYQLPIMAQFGLIAYGCCEDLTNKIDMLRQIPNLRRIGVAPVADLARCVEQIGADYSISWRPNPAEMVCVGFDENRVRRIISEGLQIARGTHFSIVLKDVSTIENDPRRLTRWAEICREEIETIT